MNISSKKTKRNHKKLTFTVGITTCYGDVSILETIKSIRNSVGVPDFKIIVIADRVPINDKIKKGFRRYKVQLIENKVETGQTKKQKQIIALAKTNILILTQDDVLLDKNALSSVMQRFEKHPDTTMISILNNPVKATSFFESVINVGTYIANKTALNWNNGNNYLSVIGRFMAFRTEFIRKFRISDYIATSDTYYYLENKRNKGIYEYISKVSVFFKNPQNVKEHLRKSSRFQYSSLEMSRFFKNIGREYKVPKYAIIKAVLQVFLENPIYTIFYFCVFLYTRFLKLNSKKVLNPVWEVDLSTKKINE